MAGTSSQGAHVGPMSRRRRHRLIVTALVCSDMIGLLVGGLAATLFRFGRLTYPVNISSVTLVYWQATAGIVAAWMVILALDGAYDIERLTWGMGELSRVGRALSLGVVAVIMGTFALKAPGLSRAWLILNWVLSLGLVATGRWIIRILLARLRRRGHLLRQVLIIGGNDEALRLSRALKAAPSTGLVPIGCVSAAEQYTCGEDVPRLGSVADAPNVIKKRGVDTVVIVSSAFDHEVTAAMISELRTAAVGVHISSGLFEVLTSRVFVRDVAGLPLLTVKGVNLTPRHLAVKRVFDVLVAGVVVLVGMPLWLAVAIAIKLGSKGPVFYRQERVGKDGRRFRMFKFRSMVVGAHAMRGDLEHANEADGPIFKLRNDPRITNVGRWMRKYSIDEFPQLLNVIRGEMSLVGPRPPLPNETEAYTEMHWRRMETLPGMTGLWQVSGRSNLSFDEMVHLDVFYIENWSMGLDLSLLLRTVPAVLLGDGAY